MLTNSSSWTARGAFTVESGRWVHPWRPAGARGGLAARAVEGGDPDRLPVEGPVARLTQVHGNRVVRAAAGTSPGADAAVTDDPDLILVVRVADCVPVFLAAPGGVGLAHAGWRGTAAGIAAAAARELAALTGSPLRRLAALVGPAIGPCCYEVGEDVAARFPAAAVDRRGARPRLDLWTANRLQLLDAGLDPAAVETARVCTRCHQHLLFSHRGSGGRPGRMEAFLRRA